MTTSKLQFWRALKEVNTYWRFKSIGREIRRDNFRLAADRYSGEPEAVSSCPVCAVANQVFGHQRFYNGFAQAADLIGLERHFACNVMCAADDVCYSPEQTVIRKRLIEVLVL